MTPNRANCARSDTDLAILPSGWGQLLAVYRVHTACFPHAYPFWRFVAYRSSTNSCIRVAVSDGQVTGYIIGTAADHVRPPALVGEIVSLAVLPEGRRQGAGRRLLQAAVQFLGRRGLQETYLQVAVDNEPALRLYRDFGFLTVETLPHYYVDGRDAYLMRYDLVD